MEVDATQKSKKENPTSKNPQNYCSLPTIKPHPYPHVSTSQFFYIFYLGFEKPEQWRGKGKRNGKEIDYREFDGGIVGCIVYFYC